MASSSVKPIELFVNCGYSKLTSSRLHPHSTIDQIHTEVRALCGSRLTGPYCLMFYHPERKKLVKLNENYLSDAFNLFRIRSPLNDSEFHFVELFVHDISDEGEFGNPLLTRVSTDEHVSKQDVPVRKRVARRELSNALLSQEQSAMMMDNNHPIDHEESIFPNAHGTQAALTPSPNEESFDSILLNDQIPINQDLNEQIADGAVMLFDTPPLAMQTTSCLHFSRDVKPEQKDIHKSDQFNQRDQTKTTGYVTRVQGIKKPEQARSSVWPLVRIPFLFRRRKHVQLVVHVVSESIKAGKRLWCLHRDKAFLPKGFTRDSIPLNPIEFEVNERTLTINGDLELDLQMTTLWDKANQPQLLYELEEHIVIGLHPAEHDAVSPRLLCLLKIDNSFRWETICLSDFIRKKSSNKRQQTPDRSRVQITPKRTRAN